MACSQHVAQKSQDRFVEWLSVSEGESEDGPDLVMTTGNQPTRAGAQARPLTQLHIQTAEDNLTSFLLWELSHREFSTSTGDGVIFFLILISSCSQEVMRKYVVASFRRNPGLLSSDVSTELPRGNGPGPGQGWQVPVQVRSAGASPRGERARGHTAALTAYRHGPLPIWFSTGSLGASSGYSLLAPGWLPGVTSSPRRRTEVDMGSTESFFV